MYFPVPQSSENWMWPRDVAIRTAGDPHSLIGAVSKAVWSVDPNQAISNVQSMDDIVAHETEERRLQTILMTSFAVLALFLAAIGLYGVLSSNVADHSGEIGVRLALGGQPTHIQAMFVRQGLALAVAGLVIGLGVAWPTTRLVADLLFHVPARDPEVFMVQPAILLVVATLAAYLPAHRASRIDALEALRR